MSEEKVENVTDFHQVLIYVISSFTNIRILSLTCLKVRIQQFYALKLHVVIIPGFEYVAKFSVTLACWKKNSVC